MQQRILLVEDNLDIAQLIKEDLEHAGFEVTHAASGASGLVSAREHLPDLVLLDLGLPDFDGIEVARRLRHSSAVPIIVLTAMDAVERKLALFEVGADDYVTKPFSSDELLARVRVQVRRQQPRSLLTLGELELDIVRRTARHEGRPLKLSPKEFEILALLMQKPGRVYSREEIVASLWSGQPPPGAGLIEVHMANLREKLRACGAFGVLRTVRGVGYGVRPA
ncbi:response regulator transcription factor [Deinococcus pimensis]|uniref:response regulator transcription factor n=1 Tax=Deinococcus pimensis TaxID=309888 RepID=UPI0004857C0F|nr:response regulator transcription factor [Deinococcus pimensis]